MQNQDFKIMNWQNWLSPATTNHTFVINVRQILLHFLMPIYKCRV